MPTFADLENDFFCPHHRGCPYLEGLSTQSVWYRYQHTAGLECEYEHQLEAYREALDGAYEHQRELEKQIEQLQAQLRALHRRQFKGRRTPSPPPRDGPCAPRKKRGAPVGHPPWLRPKPTHIDRVVQVAAPEVCPDCQCTELQPVKDLHQHVQEDILLEPRTVVTCFEHAQAYCPDCNKHVWLAGPGEMPGAYIGPAAKATAAYLRYQLNVPDRKISQFFSDFFGLKFVPASAYGFERQLVRRGLPLYEDLRQKIRALPVVHADETSWRHDGHNYWVWYAGNEDLALFHLDPHRSAEAAQSLLGERYAGTIVADAYASYKGVHPKDWQSCLAHLKTTAKELEQEVALLKGQAADPAARQFCKEIQGFVHDVCQAHRRLHRGPWRARRAKNKARALRRQLRRLCLIAFGYAKVEAFRKRLLGPEQKHFFTCFRRPQVPPTNNQAERSLRPIVIMRKVVHGTRSDKGLENHSVLRSLFETARRQGQEPHRFFLCLLTRNTAQAQATLYRNKLNTKPQLTPRC